MTNDKVHPERPLSIADRPGEFEAKSAAPVILPRSDTRPDNALWGKKTVLLVDSNSQTRESRAKVLRTLGATVHCASSPGVARMRFDSGSYNLVLVDLGVDVGGAERLAEELRSKKPRQLLAFLVGRPLFVATSLKHNNIPSRRLPRSSAGAALVQAPKPGAGVDFGQRVRDAEAEQSLDEIA
jgi:CheY-like chemotaxis protein